MCRCRCKTNFLSWIGIINALYPNDGKQGRMQNEHLLFIKRHGRGNPVFRPSEPKRWAKAEKQGTPPFFRPVREGGAAIRFLQYDLWAKNRKKKKNKRRQRNFIRQAQGQRKNNNWRGWTTVSPHPFPKRGMKYEFFFPIGKYSTRDAQYVTCELRNSRR